MRNVISVITIIVISAIMFSCGKESIEKTDATNDSKKLETNSTNTKNTVQESETKKVSNSNLYKVEAVEKSSEKKISPNVIWSEDGKKSSLDDLKGKVVLLNFWATWCGPCIREMPDLSSISEELKDKDFKMLGMNVFQQEKSMKVEDFLVKSPVSYTILDGNQEVVDAFGEATGENIEAVPTTFIIDKKGKIAETIVGARKKEDFVKLINKYLN